MRLWLAAGVLRLLQPGRCPVRTDAQPYFDLVAEEPLDICDHRTYWCIRPGHPFLVRRRGMSDECQF